MAIVNVRTANNFREFQRAIEQCREMRRTACQVSAGILEGATREDNGKPIAEYAAAHEFGTSRIPRRPFLSITQRTKYHDWQRFIANGLRGNITARMSEATARLLAATGRMMCADIQATIMSNLPPPNSPETQARKASRPGGGYAGTLYDTGQMAHSIEFELENSQGVCVGGIRGKA